MAYEKGTQNLNTGVLFRVENPSSEKAPTYTGKANVNGKDMQIAAWVQEIQNGEKAGNKYFSLKFEAPLAQGQKTTAQASPKPEEDDLPF